MRQKGRRESSTKRLLAPITLLVHLVNCADLENEVCDVYEEQKDGSSSGNNQQTVLVTGFDARESVLIRLVQD